MSWTFGELRDQLHEQLDAILDKLGGLPDDTPVASISGLAVSFDSEVEMIDPPPADPFGGLTPFSVNGKVATCTGVSLTIKVRHAPVIMKPPPRPPEDE